MKAHRDGGTDPADPEVRARAERWRDLTERTIAGFTGGDPGITEGCGAYVQAGKSGERLPRHLRRRPAVYVTRAQTAAD